MENKIKNKIPINYYLIHGIDSSRRERMQKEFLQAGIDNNEINWILHPNKNEISNELYRKIVNQQPSYTCGNYVHPNSINLGVTSCSYKHYLALKSIVENNQEYAVIMEDNMQFMKGINIPERLNIYIDELNKNYPDWDVLFDLNYGISDHITEPNKYVYPKNNAINNLNHGGTRCAQFYLIRNKCAKVLYENYLPFNNAPDWWMNDLFRKLNIQSFWADPPAVDVWSHCSTAT
jgi:GR25 family glycosyltransferase involved in LPS biosynthesis